MAALHGVEPHEVQQALAADRRLLVPGVAFGLQVLGIWARTSAGRPLNVVLRHEGGLSWLIVGVLDLTPEQVAEFEAWEAGQ